MKTSPIPFVEFQGVTKSYAGVRANDNLSFQIQRNSIHALVGENGAGKSTAMKLLFGLESPDEGKILIDGKAQSISSTLRARELGMGMVHQHFVLAQEHSALDNLLFSETKRPWQILRRKKKRHEYQDLAERYGFAIPWEKPISELSVGEQQRVEILKVLKQKAKLLILDEPTAVLTPQEVQDFFRNLKKLQEEGCTIILITHKLKEVLAICDVVTVIRQGRTVGTVLSKESSQDQLAEMMVGRRIQWTRRDLKKPPESTRTDSMPCLSIRHAQGLDLQVHPYEILGIAGVEGNGQSELIELIMNPKKSADLKRFATNRNSQLSLNIGETEVTCFSTGQMRQQSFGVFPEDRLRTGAVGEANVSENFILGYDWDPQFSSHGLLQWQQIQKETAAALEKFDVRPRLPNLLFNQFSGGNQQKIVVARELRKNPKFILAAQPTRGVDVGAVEFIHEQLLQAQEMGAGVLLISFDLDELLKISSRILVLYNKKFVLELSRSQFDEIKIGRAMGGGRREEKQSGEEIPSGAGVKV